MRWASPCGRGRDCHPLNHTGRQQHGGRGRALSHLPYSQLEPVGKQIQLGGVTLHGDWYTVVGVVPICRRRALAGRRSRWSHLPSRSSSFRPARGWRYSVRDPGAALAAVRRADQLSSAERLGGFGPPGTLEELARFRSPLHAFGRVLAALAAFHHPAGSTRARGRGRPFVRRRTMGAGNSASVRGRARWRWWCGRGSPSPAGSVSAWRARSASGGCCSCSFHGVPTRPTPRVSPSAGGHHHAAGRAGSPHAPAWPVTLGSRASVNAAPRRARPRAAVLPVTLPAPPPRPARRLDGAAPENRGNSPLLPRAREFLRPGSRSVRLLLSRQKIWRARVDRSPRRGAARCRLFLFTPNERPGWSEWPTSPRSSAALPRLAASATNIAGSGRARG